MPNTVVSIENISKLYRLGEINTGTYYRDIKRWRSRLRDLTAPLHKVGDSDQNDRSGETIWALKDINFKVQQGDALGIIGRNGAGKSTLLKILSRVTAPTSGEIKVKGRIASMLEVGTGFHPELTGRDNIYLNGAILGMEQREVRRKFDEIVDFSGVEKFIDTPVKHYSSGMYVRLGFAVAAHLDPEILIVDEILAVGDSEFQKKCLGKMGDAAHAGRTVLFVSHNLISVQSLCNSACLLDSGKIIDSGPTQEVIRNYLHSTMPMTTTTLDEREDRTGDGSVRVSTILIESEDGSKIIRSGSRLKVTIDYHSESAFRFPRFLVGIFDDSNTGIFLLDSDAVGGLPVELPPRGRVVCVTDPINLTAGSCYVNLAVYKTGNMADYVQHAESFNVEEDDIYGTGKIPPRSWVLNILKHKWMEEK